MGRPAKCGSCGTCSRCKNAAYQREWSRRNPGKKYNRDPDLALERYLKKLYREYGIIPEEYQQMFTEQNGLCAICGEPETATSHGGRVKRLAVDHDHESGHVRGLLCNNCNRGLGLLKDDLDVLRSAWDYLSGFAY